MRKEKKSERKKDWKVNKEKGEETKRKENFYVKKSEIKSVFYTNKPMFVLLYKEALLNINKLDSTLPSVFSSLLQELEDVFPDDGPNGLPPFRGIEHQIDFNFGAIIPNRLEYQTNPEETKELQQKVEGIDGKRLCEREP